MNSKILSLLSLTVLFFLSSCGDEKNKNTEDNISSKCIPSYEQWLQLEKGDSVAVTETKLNCKGTKSSEEVHQEYSGIKSSVRYNWNNHTKTPLITINYDDKEQLESKNYFPLDTKKSSCFPSKDVIDSIKHGQSLEEIEKAIGCTGQWEESKGVSSYSSAALDVEDIYSWEEPISKKTLSLIFSNGKFYDFNREQLSYLKSECIPTYAVWQGVRIGPASDSYESVLTQLGCGKGSSLWANGTSWGRTDGSTDYVWVTSGTLGDYVASKSFTLKRGTKSECIPTVENWNKLIKGLSVEETNRVLGCQGKQTYEGYEETQGSYSTTYMWMNVNLDGIGVSYSLYFNNEGLSGTHFEGNDSSYSSCNPTEQGFDKIKVGEIINIHNILGCAGMEIDKTFNYTKTYAWGDAENARNATKNYVAVKVDKDNKVISKYIYFRP